MRSSLFAIFSRTLRLVKSGEFGGPDFALSALFHFFEPHPYHAIFCQRFERLVQLDFWRVSITNVVNDLIAGHSFPASGQCPKDGVG